MEWRENAVILGIRRLGETSVVAEVMTRSRGRHLGLVRGGRSRKRQPILQPGNLVEATWRARLDEHMGTLSLEPVALRAARLMETPVGLHAIQLLATHLRLLPERDAHPRLFDGLDIIADHLGGPGGGDEDGQASHRLKNERLETGELVLRFEIALLEELGFGLDLETCAATGRQDDLAFVSPKSGRAVSAEAGEPWRDRLLVLPGFLATPGGRSDVASLRDGFALTRYFLSRHVWAPRGIDEPASRAAMIAAVEKERRQTDADEVPAGAARRSVPQRP